MLQRPQKLSRFVNGGAPTRCHNCGEPFPIVENRVEAWREGSHYFCTEFCAEGYDEPTPVAIARKAS